MSYMYVLLTDDVYLRSCPLLLCSDTGEGSSPQELGVKPEPYSPPPSPRSHRHSPYTVAINPAF